MLPFACPPQCFITKRSAHGRVRLCDSLSELVPFITRHVDQCCDKREMWRGLVQLGPFRARQRDVAAVAARAAAVRVAGLRLCRAFDCKRTRCFALLAFHIQQCLVTKAIRKPQTAQA